MLPTHLTHSIIQENSIEPFGSRASLIGFTKVSQLPSPEPVIHAPNPPGFILQIQPVSVRIPDTSPHQGVRGWGQGQVLAEQFWGGVQGGVFFPIPFPLGCVRPRHSDIHPSVGLASVLTTHRQQ